MVHLQTMQTQFEGKGLFVYAIGITSSPGAAREMNREMGIKYPVFLGTDSAIAKRYAYG